VIAALATLALAAGGAPPAVELMVVGREAVLREPVRVRLVPRTVRVGRRRCAVGAATPLSVLAGARLPLRIRDYGSCGRSARDAGGLFVTQVGRERNRGRAGWVYKVGRRAGTTPAADPSGPFGTGRGLRGGQRVVWFWCVLDRSESCQRTLEARPSRARLASGQPFRVTVRAYDDAGRGVPARGATVRFGDAVATTAGDGTARLRAPAAGGVVELRAELTGAVPAFPRRIVVR